MLRFCACVRVLVFALCRDGLGSKLGTRTFKLMEILFMVII